MHRSNSQRGGKENKADPYSPTNSPRTPGASPAWDKENSTPEVKDAPDRVALTAVRVLEAVEQENKRLRTFVDSKDLVIDELKRQTKALEDENKRMALAARKDANLIAVNGKLRKEIDSLRKELATLKETLVCEQNALEHKAEVSTMQLEQERFLKQRVQREREQLEVQGQQSKELMEEYVHQIRVLENENDALKQAILDLRKDRSNMMDKHAAEIEGMRKNWMTLLETSKSKPNLPSPKLKDATTISAEIGVSFRPAVRELLLTSLQTVMDAFGHFSKSLRTDCDTDLPWLQQISSRFGEIEEAFNEAEALSSARDEIWKMELRTSQESTLGILQQQQQLIVQYREQLAQYEELTDKLTRDQLLRSENTTAELCRYFTEATHQQQQIGNTVSSLLDERNQIADCLQGTISGSPSKQSGLVMKLWDKLKDKKKPVPGPSVEEFEDLLSELDARSSNFDRKENLLVRQMDDLRSNLATTQKELETVKKSLATKTKEVAVLSKENAKLIQKYEQVVSGTGGLKKGSIDSELVETTARGPNDPVLSVAELSKLKSELATKSLEVKEQNLEIESLKDELNRKQATISQMVQSIRESKQNSVKSGKASASSFVMLSTPSGNSSRAIDTPQLADTERSMAAHQPIQSLAVAASGSQHSFAASPAQRQQQNSHMQTEQFSRKFGHSTAYADERWRSDHREHRSTEMTFDEDSLEAGQPHQHRHATTLAERMAAHGWPHSRTPGERN